MEVHIAPDIKVYMECGEQRISSMSPIHYAAAMVTQGPGYTCQAVVLPAQAQHSQESEDQSLFELHQIIRWDYDFSI